MSGVVAGGGASGSSFGSTNGVGTAALFYSPNGVAVDTSGNVIVADLNNHKVRLIYPFTCSPGTFANFTSRSCFLCLPGSFSSASMATSCSPCARAPLQSPTAPPPARSAQEATTAPRARPHASNVGAATTALMAPRCPSPALSRLCLCPTPLGRRTLLQHRAPHSWWRRRTASTTVFLTSLAATVC